MRWTIGLAAILGAYPDLGWAQTSVHEFRLGGSAAVLDEECIRLTPDLPYVSGSAWFREPVDPSRPFEVRMSLVLGSKDAAGADGIVFVLHPGPGTGRAGEGMGFAGMAPSLGLEFDTYRNLHLGDPVSDHLAMMQDGGRHHLDGEPPVVLGNLEDGARHPLRIQWEPDGELEVYLDGRRVAAYPSRLLTQTFDGRPRIYWGFTGGTGRLSNAQDVCIEKQLLSRRRQTLGAYPEKRNTRWFEGYLARTKLHRSRK